MLSIAQPADRLLEGQTRRADPHRAVLELVETRGEAAQRNGIVPPLTAALHIPARLHRREMPLAPVAPLPAAAVGQKIVRQAVQMQRKVAHLLLMGAEDRLQAAIDALLRDLYPGQRPANFVNVQRVDHPPARPQQRPGVKRQLRADQRPAELGRQRGVKDHLPQLGLAGESQRQVAVIHAQLARADIQHRVAFSGMPLGENIQATADDHLFRALLPVTHRQRHAAAQRIRLVAGAPAAVADGDPLRSDLPRQVQNRLYLTPRGDQQLAAIVLPLELSIDPFRSLREFEGALHLAIDRQAIRHQRQMEGPHQLHRRLIVSQPGAELADGKRLAAQARLQAQIVTGKADILLRRGQ